MLLLNWYVVTFIKVTHILSHFLMLRQWILYTFITLNHKSQSAFRQCQSFILHTFIRGNWKLIKWNNLIIVSYAIFCLNVHIYLSLSVIRLLLLFSLKRVDLSRLFRWKKSIWSEKNASDRLHCKGNKRRLG